MEDEGRPTDWVARCCLDYTGCDPQAFMESLFEDERCVAFGPIHHFLVGAVLLTCYRNAGGDTGASALEEHLRKWSTAAIAYPVPPARNGAYAEPQHR